MPLTPFYVLALGSRAELDQVAEQRRQAADERESLTRRIRQLQSEANELRGLLDAEREPRRADDAPELRGRCGRAGRAAGRAAAAAVWRGEFRLQEISKLITEVSTLKEANQEALRDLDDARCESAALRAQLKDQGRRADASEGHAADLQAVLARLSDEPAQTRPAAAAPRVVPRTMAEADPALLPESRALLGGNGRPRQPPSLAGSDAAGAPPPPQPQEEAAAWAALADGRPVLRLKGGDGSWQASAARNYHASSSAVSAPPPPAAVAPCCTSAATLFQRGASWHRELAARAQKKRARRVVVVPP
ncbi:unnamed protein product, partial [Prorocentrum cordatum]